MDVSEIITAVTTVGFPIVAYGALFWYIITKDKAHADEVNKMTEAINNNTIALTKLIDKMGSDDK